MDAAQPLHAGRARIRQDASDRRPPPCSTAPGRRSPPHSSSIRKAAWQMRWPSRDTWSGIIVHWPVDDADEPLPIEMSGLPAVRPRPPVCRLSRLRHLPRRRPAGRAGAAPGAARGRARPRRKQTTGQRAAVSPRRRPSETPALSPVEHNAFQELGARTQRPAQENRRQKAPTQHAPDDFGAEPTARRPSPRRAPRATATPPAIPKKAGRSSTACRSASWSTGSTL